MVANAKCMRYGNKFQVEDCDPQTTVLNKIILHELGSSSIRTGRFLSLMCAQGRNEKRTRKYSRC